MLLKIIKLTVIRAKVLIVGPLVSIRGSGVNGSVALLALGLSSKVSVRASSTITSAVCLKKLCSDRNIQNIYLEVCISMIWSLVRGVTVNGVIALPRLVFLRELCLYIREGL